MPRFKKKIVTPAVHSVGRLDGSEEKESITPARIKDWVNNTKKLKDLGVLIPAPLAHQDKNKRLAFPVIKAKDGETLADAYTGTVDGIPPAWDLANLNAGFWDSFDQDQDGSLIGEVDVPGDENDTNSFAGKVSKTIKQTSVLVMPGRKIVGKDGQEHEVGEHLAHVALCLHAQEPGQENFSPTTALQPLSSVPDSLAMSFVIAMDDITGLPDPTKPKDEELYQVVTLLRSSLNVALPEDVTRENFLQSLKLVLTQKLADQREQKTEDSVRQRPEGAVSKSPSIAMSKTNQSTESNSQSTSKTDVILMSMLNKNKRKELKDRVKRLVETARIGKEYADKLFARVDAFAMSSADINDKGEFNTSSLEDLIEGLEEAMPLTGPSVLEDETYTSTHPADGIVENMPKDVIVGAAVEDLSDKAMDAVLDSCNW